ncbi:MAG: hypothetical protein DRP79_07830 [Planctomycetota bacterium]|nr:MAG: hypothetical protein DRP79_07830 [Planctomycetota bacterium]
MSETKDFLKESSKALQPIAAEMFKAVVNSLGKLCGGAVAFGEPAITAGTKESLPQALTGPLAAAVCESTGEIAGQFTLVVDVSTARALAALMLGGEPPEESAETLGQDESDAFRELGANAASAVGSALRATLSCEASVAIKTIETPESEDKLEDVTGKNAVFISAEGAVAERKTAILLACETEMCRAAVAAAARAEMAPEEPEKEEKLPENLSRILKIRVPVIVVLAEKMLTFQEVLNINEGMVLEFEKNSSEPLDLLVNDRKVGTGYVVKIGERFGLKIGEIGNAREIVEKL